MKTTGMPQSTYPVAAVHGSGLSRQRLDLPGKYPLPASSANATKPERICLMFPEAARILTAMAQASVELIGAGDDDPAASDEIRKMIAWFANHAAPGIERAIEARRRGAA